MGMPLERLLARRKRHVYLTDVLAKASLVLGAVAASVTVEVVATLLFVSAGLSVSAAMGFLLRSHHEGILIDAAQRSAPRSKAKRAVGC